MSENGGYRVVLGAIDSRATIDPTMHRVQAVGMDVVDQTAHFHQSLRQRTPSASIQDVVGQVGGFETPF